jgi:hypothetical protein
MIGGDLNRRAASARVITERQLRYLLLTSRVISQFLAGAQAVSLTA